MNENSNKIKVKVITHEKVYLSKRIILTTWMN